MADFSASFLEYLKIYNPSAYDKINADNVKPEELNALYNANISNYEVWDSIPQAIRNRYPGMPVPQDVWDAAARGEIYTLREMEYHPEIKRVEEAREIVAEKHNMPSDIVNDLAAAAFIAAVAAGYSHHASHHLALNRQTRESLSEKARTNTLSDEERKIWLDTRKSDIEIIKKDWAENQPEKMLMRLLSQYNRGKLSPEEMEKFPQTVEDIMQKITSPDNNRMDKLLEYLKTPAMQAKIGRFKEETIEILAHTVLKKIPTAEREQYLARDFHKRREELRNLPADTKARMVSDNINHRHTNLPKERTLSTKERYANMPSALNRERTM